MNVVKKTKEKYIRIIIRIKTKHKKNKGRKIIRKKKYTRKTPEKYVRI